MYIVNTYFQNRVFLLSVGFGTVLGLVYDLFRLVRIVIDDKKHGVFVQDFLFLALSTFLTFLFLLVVNNGSFRFYIFAAMLTGFFAYYFTLGSIFIRVSGVAVKTLKRFFTVVAAVISAPIRLIISIFKRLSQKITPKMAKMTKKFKNNCKIHLKKI